MYHFDDLNLEVSCDNHGGWLRRVTVNFRPLDEEPITVGVRNPTHVLDRVTVEFTEASDMDKREMHVGLWGRGLTLKGEPNARQKKGSDFIGVVGEDVADAIGELIAPLNVLVPVAPDHVVVAITTNGAEIAADLKRSLGVLRGVR